MTDTSFAYDFLRVATKFMQQLIKKTEDRREDITAHTEWFLNFSSDYGKTLLAPTLIEEYDFLEARCVFIRTFTVLGLQIFTAADSAANVPPTWTAQHAQHEILCRCFEWLTDLERRLEANVERLQELGDQDTLTLIAEHEFTVSLSLKAMTNQARKVQFPVSGYQDKWWRDPIRRSDLKVITGPCQCSSNCRLGGENARLVAYSKLST